MLDSFQITLTGGVAVFYSLITLLVLWYATRMIYHCIFGGKMDISFEAEGLIPKMKRWRKKGYDRRNDKHFP